MHRHSQIPIKRESERASSLVTFRRRCVLYQSLTLFDCSCATVVRSFLSCVRSFVLSPSLISVLFLILRLSFNLFLRLFLSSLSYTVGILNFRITSVTVGGWLAGWLNVLFYFACVYFFSLLSLCGTAYRTQMFSAQSEG